MPTDHVSVYVACPDRETARRIARALVERKLAACANLLPIESVYRWEGRVEESAEVAMFLKTRRARVPEVVRAVEELHPYEVPCVVAFDLVGGAARYLAWVDAETS
ncbi:MAG TPA: divalent-cation tolerance protein CutA [Candidatus Thermoplasmatota archaeon]|nr:divalent-cation tolerance protein CutA [Candidatus Thermoplasmatota archaeon]